MTQMNRKKQTSTAKPMMTMNSALVAGVLGFSGRSWASRSSVLCNIGQAPAKLDSTPNDSSSRPHGKADSVDPPSSQHPLAIVKHDCLTGRDTVARFVEAGLQPAVRM